MAELHHYGMMNGAENNALLQECAEYSGIAEPESDDIFRACVESAAELCRRQTGEQEDSPVLRQLIRYTAHQMYYDRAGELSNKQSSAMSGLMHNARLALRLGRDADERTDP